MNAVKYTSRGEVRLTASLSDDGAMFEVRDTGRGIAEEDLPHIFDPFWQVHAHRGTAKAGVGLGLSVVQHLTMLLGGSVAVESAVGVGSTFRVFVPSAPSPDSPDPG
jgi:two-component system sensor histidine kinase BaeS